MVEGKGFDHCAKPNPNDLGTLPLQQPAPTGIPRPPASTVPDSSSTTTARDEDPGATPQEPPATSASASGS